MAKRKKWQIIADKTPHLIRSCKTLNYTQNTTVLSLTKTYIIQKIPLPCYWRTRRVWRYQRGNPNPYIEEEQTTQWPKEKVQKDKQRSTKNAYKTKDRVTRTSLKTGGELACSGRVSSSCSTTSAIITVSMHSKVTRNNYILMAHDWYGIIIFSILTLNL